MAVAVELEDMTEQEFTSLGTARVDEELAEAFRTYPILYDKSIKEFKDQKKKENAWKRVAVQKYWTHPLFSSSNFFPLSSKKKKQNHRKGNKCFFRHF